jgi:hypothetical protein
MNFRHLCSERKEKKNELLFCCAMEKEASPEQVLKFLLLGCSGYKTAFYAAYNAPAQEKRLCCHNMSKVGSH